jgi:hypothetical protein
VYLGGRVVACLNVTSLYLRGQEAIENLRNSKWSVCGILILLL